MDEILRIEDVRVYYHERERTIKAVDGVDLTLRRGETLAIVGESGCGKTTIALAALDLVPKPGAIESGHVFFDGRDVLTLPAGELRAVRGRRISMIFQDPQSGLNPVLNIGSQVEEMIRTHLSVPKRESRRMAAEALRRQGLSDVDRLMDSYPFQLSGGMCQRVMIAIATVLHPDIIIADEPTSALDVTVQAGILRELNELKRNLGASIILITHDLGVVAQMADEMAVMYAGRIVEQGNVREVFARPTHPYTSALLAARPRLDNERQPLQPIRGAPPDLAELSGECAFLPRCSKAVVACRTQPWPALAAGPGGHAVACYNPMFHPVST
ncbi:MAG: ABC transporter ATP-binding protein [Dehalococcoidia bacterium]